MLEDVPPPAPSPRAQRPVFMAAMLSLIAVLFLAFWLLCSLQVRRSEARRSASEVYQTAFADCLQYVAGSTIGSCTARLGQRPTTAMVDSD